MARFCLNFQEMRSLQCLSVCLSLFTDCIYHFLVDSQHFENFAAWTQNWAWVVLTENIDISPAMTKRWMSYSKVTSHQGIHLGLCRDQRFIETIEIDPFFIYSPFKLLSVNLTHGSMFDWFISSEAQWGVFVSSQWLKRNTKGPFVHFWSV